MPGNNAGLCVENSKTSRALSIDVMNLANLIRKFYRRTVGPRSVWARPQMLVTFRAELMPGKSKEERTFRIEKVLPNGRVTLFGFEGEFYETEFEKQRFLRR